MRTYCISYDLRKPGRNYDDLYTAIKGCGAWCHCLESIWLVRTTYSASQIRDLIWSTMDANDSIVVFQATAPGAWHGLSDQISDWLKSNLQ